MAKQITGRFCERKLVPKRSFDVRSFRWKKKGKNWLLIGCPKGKWAPQAGRCKVGTKAHVLLVAARGKGLCRVGRRVVKG
jgi:hypothetical protein